MRKTLTAGVALALFSGTAVAGVSFNDDIRPILADRCFACHGPDAAARKANLRLDREETAKAALKDGGIPIVAGKPGESAILHRLTTDDPDDVMPPPKAKLSVSRKEIELIRQWISEGANWERHWAFIPPKKQAPGAVSDAGWPRNGIDPYILAQLESEGLKPAPPADPTHLLRRVTFDLTGLPPTIAELDAFIADPSDQAYGRAVDRLLASPAFGERLAQEWLDVARYGDTDGLFEDHPRSIYPWRDWVVSAINDNLAYNDFITWQLAGDLLPDATTQQKTATGFIRNNPTSNEGGIIDEDYRIKYLVDRVNTTSTAFLGLTMECAQCHDHKFDPMTQREYFEMGGFFNSLVGRGNTKGSTAPTLKMIPPDKEKRLEAIGKELGAIDETLKGTPPQLAAHFEKWLAELNRPIEWREPEIVAQTSPDGEPAKTKRESAIRGRFVRIALPKGKTGFITISEVQIFSSGRNIARVGSASQSSNYSAKNKAERAINGNANGTFASCSCTTEQADAWWEIDLGAEFPIDHILVFNRNDCCPERLDNVSVDVLDGDRKPASELKIGDAPFKSAFTLNPDAPPPKDTANTYEITLDFPPSQRRIAALQFSGEKPGVIASVRAEAVSEGKPRPLKIVGGKFNFGEKPAVVSLEKPDELKAGEHLKLTISGDRAKIRITADESAIGRAKIPQGREKRLAHFRGTWKGFADSRAKREALTKEKASLDGSAVVTMIAGDEGKMRPGFILERGEYDKRGEEVQPAAPASIMEFSDDLPKNRLGLARWMIDPNNPLTARVAVNRYWQMIFGTGLVLTSEDFGTQGARPSHRELLDFLAVAFVESGWDVKRLLRTMVTSATYRQSSAQPATIAQMDPANRLLSHAPRRRLPAEFIRDHALAVSGLLVEKRGGPGVHPYQPAVLFGRNAIGSSKASFKLGSGDDLYRRSLYTYWKRQIPAANMRILGADGRNSCRTRREKTNTPLQALVLLNDPQFVEAARAFAERIIAEGGASPKERLAYAFRLATSRHPNPSESAILAAEFDDRIKDFKANPDRAKSYLNGGGVRKPNPAIEPAELAAYAAVSSLILNLDESISKN